MDLTPIRILEIEIEQPLFSVMPERDKDTGHIYQQALCLVRLHGRPLGTIEIDLANGPISAYKCAQHIWRVLSAEINAHLHEDNLPIVKKLDVEGLPCCGMPHCIEERKHFLAKAPFVSIIVPTHRRPERIPNCLKALLSVDYPHYEVIIVDNAPDTDATASFIRETYHDLLQVRYIREEHPGVSWARNRGILVARGEILAFTDDDVIVDRYWLVELVKTFYKTTNVGCVTGLILSAELETPAQILFEKHDKQSGYNDNWRFNRHIFSKQKRHIHLSNIALFGAGASMAFRADLLRAIGGFDPALGTQGLVQSGEDIAAFFQILMQGYQVVYEPASLVYHKNRREYAALCQQIYHYGIGATAYITKNLLEHPQLLADLFTKVPFALLTKRSTLSTEQKQQLPLCCSKELTKLARKGMLRGPFIYLKSRWTTQDQRKVLASSEINDAPLVEKGALVQ